MDMSGTAPSTGDGSFSGKGGITGSFTAYNALSRMMIESVSISSMSAYQDVSGTWLFAEAQAKVNGTPASVYLRVSKTSTGARFSVEDPATENALAGGIGEAGRADVAITISPIV
jgi:hypothetical protein